MRATVLLKSKTDTLFVHHHQALTAAVLNKISAANPELADCIHNDADQPKPLIHSRLMGLQHGKDCFSIAGLVTLEIGWRADVVDALAQGVALQSLWRICDTEFETLEVSIQPSVPPQKEGRFYTLSPIIADNPENEGYTRWIVYKNDPDAFLARLEDNLYKRCTWLKGTTPKGRISISAPRGLSTRFLKWENLWFPAAEGILDIKGDPLLVQLAHETGVGRHPAMGFGMLSFDEGGLLC